jgi:hypothetical protein
MNCIHNFFTYLPDRNASAESFLAKVSVIDPLAAAVGSVWYLLVAENLDGDEYAR